MLNNAYLRSTVFALVVPACFSATAQEMPWLADARQVAGAVPPKLLHVLKEEIAKGGEASAIGVCAEQAPKMAKAASEQSGWSIRRVSLKNRNPKAAPDAWERAALQEFDARAANGEPVGALEKWATVANGDKQELRYIKALPVQTLCLSCHGDAAAVSADVATQIKNRYPNDLGTGYSIGQIRGAITLRKAG